MRRSLLNKRILPKPLRQALVLFTLLLLPSAAWGGDPIISIFTGYDATTSTITFGNGSTGEWSLYGETTGVLSTYNTNQGLQITNSEGSYQSSFKLISNFTVSGTIALNAPLCTINMGHSDSSNPTGSISIKYDPSGVQYTQEVSNLQNSLTTGNNTFKITNMPMGGNEQAVTFDNNHLIIEFNNLNPGNGAFYISSIELSSELTKAITNYDLWIGGTQVNSENASNVLGDDLSGGKEPSVTFTPAEGTNPAKLTLNSATIIPESDYYGIEYSGTEDLTIILKGSNTVSCSGTGKAIKYSGTLETPPTLTFAKGDENPCSLVLESETTTTIDGFDNVVNTGLFRIDETILGADQSSTYKTTITSTLLSGGSGTSSDDPILIKTAEDLRDFAKLVNNGTITNQYIKLNPEGGELECNGLTGFEPIGILNTSYNYPFIGKFDGNNCTIKNLTYSTNGTGDRVGLFGYVGKEGVSDTKIEKLTLSSCSFNGGEYAGGIVGELKNGTIENCVLSSCTVKSGNAHVPYAGGIAGYVRNGTISTCTFNSGLVDCTTTYSGEPSNGVHAGGIVGAIETENSDIDVTVSSCIVSSTNVKGVHSGAVNGPYKIYVGGLVGHSLGTVKISDNKVTTTDKTKKISCQSGVDYTEYLCGAIIGEKGDETTLTNNTYEYDVTTEIAGVSKSGNTQRGIGQDDDVLNQVMMAGTKKVNISITDLSGDRTLSPGEDMGSTYYLEEYDDSPGPLKALYVLPGNNVSLIVSSENGHKPTFTLDNDVTVTTTPEFESESDFWKIKYDFKMPEDDVTATIAFAIDLASQLYTLETDQEAYTYTGDGIEPSISLTISTDQDNPVTLTKGTDYEIQKCMKDVEGTLTPIFEEDGKTPKTPVDAGSYQIYISGIGSYTGEAVLEFSIEKRDANLCLWFYHLVDGKEEQVMTSEEATYGTAYNAPKLKNPFNLAVTLSCNSNNAENGTPSDVATIDADGNLTILKAGTVYVYAVTEGNDNCNGGDVHYQLNIGKGSLGNVTITEIEDQVYTGSAIEPELTVTTPDGTSVTTDDYSITFSDNINAGEVTITLTAKEISEKYEGSTTATFTIKQLDISEADITLDNTELTYNGEQQTVNVTKVMVGDIEVPVDCYEVSGKTGTEAKDYTLTVSAKTQNSDGSDFKNNFTGSASITWKINHRTASATELGFSTETQTASTYYNPNEDFNLPEGYVGYIITGINGTEVLTTRVSYIPKGIAVLVEKGTSSENATDEVPNPDLLPLKGTLEPKDVTSITGGTVYVLYNGEFVKSTSGTIPGKRCYLLIDTSVAAGTRSFSIDHGDGSTGIDSALVYDNDEKAGDKWHDLQGRSIEKPTRAGLYIKNGKKVVIK